MRQASRASRTPTFEVHCTEDDRAAELRRDVAAGLLASPKRLSPKWLYDARGMELFDAITRLPEYYPTRCERELLRTRADRLAALTMPETLVEIGSGACDKTRLLLRALLHVGTLRRFVPFDVCEPALRQAAGAMAREYPALEVHGVVGDFERHLSRLPRQGPTLVAFLGGTLGNLAGDDRARLLSAIAGVLAPCDALLLGVDLIKSRERLLAAYDDAAGVTRAFDLNLLRRLDGELGAEFDLARFRHVARWDDEHAWIEMHLASTCRQRVWIGALGLAVGFEEGETICTEISAKFTRDGLEGELSAAGLHLCGFWTDADHDFALALFRRAP